MMWSNRKRAQGLIAQSLYEPLSEVERAELDALLERMPELKSEAQELQRLVDAVPADAVAFEGDLAPAVMAEVSASRDRHRAIVPHWAVSLAAFALVASAIGYWIVMHPPAAVAPGPSAEIATDSTVAVALAEADRLEDSRQFTQAYRLLAHAVETAPRDAFAGRAYQRMADLAFEELEWYPEAFAGYDVLRHRYVDQFRSDPENFTRLNLLDETRDTDNSYAKLRALDAARRDGSFEKLEDIAARNPATYLASAASSDMAVLVAREEGFDVDTGRVRAMRLAQFRSKNPVAKTQLKLEVAHLLATQPEERDRARELYVEIADGPITILAEAARKSLADFERTGAAQPQF